METDEKDLTSVVSQLDAKILGLTLGILFGVIIFIATNWLVIKGGNVVGAHLLLLSQFFIGYKVSFLGSIIGLGYGFIAGTIFGVLVGWIYNKLLFLSKK
ncbi:MAG: bacteriophage holin [Thermodesulfobacteriota bacterium]